MSRKLRRGKLLHYQHLEYDIQGNLLKEICTNSRGDIIYSKEKEYNSNDDIVKWRIIGKSDFDGIMKEYIVDIEYYP